MNKKQKKKNPEKTKVCSKCGIEKSVDCFWKNKRNPDGLYYWCKECQREYQRERCKKNPERYREYDKKWRKNNPEKARAIRNKARNKVRATLKGKLNSNMGVMVREALKENKAGRHWEELVGYTLEKVKQRLSVNFTKGMSWDKLLNGEIHIDHKKPQSLFNFTGPEDQAFKDCWALCNLQPLWAIDNFKKNNKFKRP